METKPILIGIILGTIVFVIIEYLKDRIKKEDKGWEKSLSPDLPLPEDQDRFIVIFETSRSKLHSELVFPNCKSIGDVRSWLNSSSRFINVGDHIINLDQIQFIKIQKKPQEIKDAD